MLKELKSKYLLKEEEISKRLNKFKLLKEKEFKYEFIFCLLTPGSKAQKCWEAVEEIKLNSPSTEKEVSLILRGKSRFHNNKAKRVIEGLQIWEELKEKLNNPDRLSLRNWFADNVNGYGLKESAHFLRNIGKSENQIAILDRHILKHLALNGVIEKTDKIKSRNHYLEIEEKFKKFSKEVKIPLDHLDLLWWSEENGEVFK